MHYGIEAEGPHCPLLAAGRIHQFYREHSLLSLTSVPVCGECHDSLQATANMFRIVNAQVQGVTERCARVPQQKMCPETICELRRGLISLWLYKENNKIWD
jgi:hypothetical protein